MCENKFSSNVLHPLWERVYSWGSKFLIIMSKHVVKGDWKVLYDLILSAWKVTKELVKRRLTQGLFCVVCTFYFLCPSIKKEKLQYKVWLIVVCRHKSNTNQIKRTLQRRTYCVTSALFLKKAKVTCPPAPCAKMYFCLGGNCFATDIDGIGQSYLNKRNAQNLVENCRYG